MTQHLGSYMSLENEIIQVLKNKVPEFVNINEQQLELIQEGAYHLHTTPAYFIKWIPNGDQLGENEIWINQTILKNASIPTPQLICTTITGEGSIACWEWLEGKDLRFQYRDRLPLAFTKLGEFHAQQHNNLPVFSLITHHSYRTISELLKAELEFLCSFHDSYLFQKARSIFSLLELGYPTYVHGDLHPGNIRLIGNNVKFVDWGYCRNSLSLFDLGYTETVHFDGTELNEWWRITPEESALILPVYYNACGLNGFDFNQIHYAVMLWSKLWSYSNCIKNDNKNEALICRQHIDQLISSV